MTYPWTKKRKPRPLYWRVGQRFAQALKAGDSLAVAARKAAAVLNGKNP